jgi:hypothetical protein
MNTVKLTKIPDYLKQMISRAYPDYRGRKVSLCPQSYPLNVKSYWEGGSRSYFTFMNLATGQVQQMPAQSAFDQQIKGSDSVMLPDGIACFERIYFCGKDLGIRIHLNPLNMAKLLPSEVSNG